MALCERCQAEITRPQDRLPEPWFDHDRHLVAGHHVSPRVWQVLEILWRRRRLMVTTESLMTLLYSDFSDPPGPEMLKCYICLLRKPLRMTPFAIQTERERGYRLVDNRIPGVSL